MHVRTMRQKNTPPRVFGRTIPFSSPLVPKERREVPALFKTGLARPFSSALVPKERWEVPALFKTGLARPFLSARVLTQS